MFQLRERHESGVPSGRQEAGVLQIMQKENEAEYATCFARAVTRAGSYAGGARKKGREKKRSGVAGNSARSFAKRASGELLSSKRGRSEKWRTRARENHLL